MSSSRENQYTWLSVDTKEILNSVGVQKTLSMEFEGIDTEYLDVLLDYELEDLADLLNRFHFPCSDPENLDSYIGKVSCVAYDDDLRPRAVLLASDAGDELLVNYLFGFSSKRPQYILAVCQAFVRSIRDFSLDEKYRRITMLSVNRSVTQLLKRVLDKNVKITKHSDAGEDSAAYQKNIAEKRWIIEHKEAN